MQAARAQLDDANSTMLKTSGAEAYLVGSCLDPSIAIRQRELTAKKQELLAERSVAVVATKGPAYQVHCATIARDNASNSMRLFGMDLSTGPFAAGKNKEELQRANAVLAEEQPKLEAALAVVAEVDEKLRSLDVEQKELDRLKLVP